MRPILVACWLGLESSPAGAQCPCDCGGDGAVTVDDLLTIVNVAQGTLPIEVCPSADSGSDLLITIDELLSCVQIALSGCPPPAASPTPSPSPTATAGAIPPIPTSAFELRAWLQAGHYRGWTAESDRHVSLGPHGRFVRTYLNDTVIASLQAGNATHPAGSALVKELYFSGTTVQAWAVEIKVQDDSAGGAGWYWWEGEGLAGFGLGICTNCHRSDYNGLTSRDFVLTPFPLQ